MAYRSCLVMCSLAAGILANNSGDVCEFRSRRALDEKALSMRERNRLTLRFLTICFVDSSPRAGLSTAKHCVSLRRDSLDKPAQNRHGCNGILAMYTQMESMKYTCVPTVAIVAFFPCAVAAAATIPSVSSRLLKCGLFGLEAKSFWSALRSRLVATLPFR